MKLRLFNSPKPIIGMIHVQALPGTPANRLPLDKIIAAAVNEARIYRAAGLERLFRDVQGARFHRPQERAQLRFTGRLALGLDLNEQGSA